MNTPAVNVNIKRDKSVEKLIQKNNKKLLKKYNRKLKTNETLLNNERSVPSRIFSVFLSVITITVMIFTIIFCVGTIYSAYNKTAPTFFGYSTMKVASGSMSASSIIIDGVEYESGFDIGETIVVRSVDTKTLKVGDKIAFYAYPKNYNKYHQVGKEEITVSPDTKTKYKLSARQFFGFQTKELTEAALENAMLTFHHITNVYKDTNGKLWFKTQGSSNSTKDTWYISEEMVVGIFSRSSTGNFVSKVVNLVSTDWGFIVLLLLPIGLLTIILVRSFIKDLQLALLELDVVEERRKLTDEICIKNKIGYRMDTKTKYKVLAQASDDEKLHYLTLLWHNGSAPNAVKKYIIRKKHILKPNKRLLELDRECKKMYHDGEKIEKITEYYTTQKELIKQHQIEVEKRIKNIHKILSEKEMNKED